MEEEVGEVSASLFEWLLEHVACFFLLVRAEKARKSLGSKCDLKDLLPAERFQAVGSISACSVTFEQNEGT